MSDWKCLSCGYSRKNDEDGFQVLGYGYLKCPSCGTIHYLKNDLTLMLCPTDELNFKETLDKLLNK